jgi:cytochrome c-type biogenesis protein CcmE
MSMRPKFGKLAFQMTSGVKLLIGGLLVATAIGYLAFLGAASSWQYYLSVDEAVLDEEHLLGKRIRVSGRVGVGSLAIVDDRRHATFVLHGELHKLDATCRCAMPDNFAENIDVVVEGTLQNDGIHGHKVITRCASKYNPKEMINTPNGSPDDLPERRSLTSYRTPFRR